MEGGEKGCGDIWSSDIAVSSLSLGAWIDLERSSKVSSTMGVDSSAMTGGGAEVGIVGSPGALVSFDGDCGGGLGLGVGVDGKDSDSIESPSSVKTFGGKYCEPEQYDLGSGWWVPIGDGHALMLDTLAEDWSFISLMRGLRILFAIGCFYMGLAVLSWVFDFQGGAIVIRPCVDSEVLFCTCVGGALGAIMFSVGESSFRLSVLGIHFVQ